MIDEMEGQEIDLVEEEVPLDEQSVKGTPYSKKSSSSTLSKRKTLLRSVVVGSSKKPDPVDVDAVSLSTMDTAAREESRIDDMGVEISEGLSELTDTDADKLLGTSLEMLREPASSKKDDEEQSEAEVQRYHPFKKSPSTTSSQSKRSFFPSFLVSSFKKPDLVSSFKKPDTVTVEPIGSPPDLEITGWEESKPEEELGVEIADLSEHDSRSVTASALEDAREQPASVSTKKTDTPKKDAETLSPRNTKEKAIRSNVEKKENTLPGTLSPAKKEKKARSAEKKKSDASTKKEKRTKSSEKRMSDASTKKEKKTKSSKKTKEFDPSTTTSKKEKQAKKSVSSTPRQKEAVEGAKEKRALAAVEKAKLKALEKETKGTIGTKKKKAAAAVATTAVTKTAKKSKTSSPKNSATTVVEASQKQEATAAEQAMNNAEETLPGKEKEIPKPLILTENQEEASASAPKATEEAPEQTDPKQKLEAKSDSSKVPEGKGRVIDGIGMDANKFKAKQGTLEAKGPRDTKENKSIDQREDTKHEGQGETPIEEPAPNQVSAEATSASIKEPEEQEITLGSEPVKVVPIPNDSKKKRSKRWSLIPTRHKSKSNMSVKSCKPDSFKSISKSTKSLSSRVPVSKSATPSSTPPTKKQVASTTGIEKDIPDAEVIDDESTSAESPVESLGIVENDHKIVTATIVKKSKSTKTGIKFLRRDDGVFFVSGISDTGLFSKTNLKVGDRVVSVNNMSCNGKTVQDIEKLFRETKGFLTVLIKRPWFKDGVPDEDLPESMRLDQLMESLEKRNSVEDEIGLRALEPELSADGLVFQEPKASRTKRRPMKKPLSFFSFPKKFKPKDWEEDPSLSDGSHEYNFPEAVQLFADPDYSDDDYTKRTDNSEDTAHASTSAPVYRVDWKTDLAEDLCFPLCCVDDRAVDEYKKVENRQQREEYERAYQQQYQYEDSSYTTFDDTYGEASTIVSG